MKSQLTPQEIRQRFTGPVASIPTPFAADGEIDFDGVANIIETAIAGGSGTILLTPGDSQFFFQSEDETAMLTRFVIERTAGRALTVACTGDWATRQSLSFAEFCRDQGADLLMSFPPAQIMSGSGLVAHYRALSAVMPVMLIGCPAFQVLDQLVDLPAICCFKEDGTEAYAVELLQKYGSRWKIMTGGSLFRHLLEWPFGANTFMDWTTSVMPQIGATYWQALQQGDVAAASRITREVERPIFDLSATIDPGFGWQMLWHAMLEIHNIAPRYLRLPHPTATDEQVARIREALPAILQRL